MKKLNKNKKRKGFTIVELIVVMAIIAVLILIAVPTLTKYLDDANNTADLGTANAIYKSAMATGLSESIAEPITVAEATANTTTDTGELVDLITDGVTNVDAAITVGTYTTAPTATTYPTATANWQVLYFATGTDGANDTIDPSEDIYIISPIDGTNSTLYKNGTPLN